MVYSLCMRKNRSIVDIRKMKAQHNAGLSIRQLSIIHGIPYATLYRAIKGK